MPSLACRLLKLYIARQYDTLTLIYGMPCILGVCTCQSSEALMRQWSLENCGVASCDTLVHIICIDIRCKEWFDEELENVTHAFDLSTFCMVDAVSDVCIYIDN